MKSSGMLIRSGISQLFVVALVLGMSACANKSATENDPEAAGAGTESTTGVSTAGTDEGNVSTSASKNGSGSGMYDDMSPADLASLLKEREFFFEFDSFTLSNSAKKALVAHGKFLAKTPAARVRLEGHTDERGTREYNLALGERRAKAAQQVLMSAGAQSRQIEVITFGEERPRAEGSNEAAYKQNRRVDIKYTVSAP